MNFVIFLCFPFDYNFLSNLNVRTPIIDGEFYLMVDFIGFA